MSDPDLLAALRPVLQWTDVMGVLRANGSALDLPYLRGGAVELEVSDLLDRALDEAEQAGA